MIDFQNDALRQKRKSTQKLMKRIARNPRLNEWLHLAPYWDQDLQSIGIASEDYLFYFDKAGKHRWFMDLEDLKTRRTLFNATIPEDEVLPQLLRWLAAPLPAQRIEIEPLTIENWHALFQDWLDDHADNLRLQGVRFEVESLPQGNKSLHLKYKERSGKIKFKFAEGQLLLVAADEEQLVDISADPLRSFGGALLNMKYDFLEVENDAKYDWGTHTLREEITYFSTLDTPYDEAEMDDALIDDVQKRIEHVVANLLPLTDPEAEMLLDFLKSDFYGVWHTFMYAIMSAPSWPFHEKLLLRWDPKNAPLIEIQIAGIRDGARMRTSPRMPTQSPMENPAAYLNSLSGKLTPAEANMVLEILHCYSEQLDPAVQQQAYNVIIDSGLTTEFAKAYADSLISDQLKSLAQAIVQRHG